MKKRVRFSRIAPLQLFFGGVLFCASLFGGELINQTADNAEKNRDAENGGGKQIIPLHQHRAAPCGGDDGRDAGEIGDQYEQDGVFVRQTHQPGKHVLGGAGDEIEQKEGKIQPLFIFQEGRNERCE